MTGKLILIGCGPGAGDLLTLRAVRRIQCADVILYDRLVGEDWREFASSDAIIKYVGKAPGDGGVQQAALNAEIAAHVAAGRTVARLKSGDPMIFGRAAEEISAVLALEAEIEIVPGVTSALAAASDSIITVTERAELQSFVVTTGRTAKADEQPDWAKIVKPGVCAAFYMGVAQAWKIQSTLMAAGVPFNAPCDWVERAGQPGMRHVSTTLSRLAHDTHANQVSNPAILLVRYPYSLAKAVSAERAIAAADSA
ncbi:MAG: uroporphyrinogen-III C-methyltransferase [Hirschia sp.]|nr:uroporphyrinogen-III C-methyltransferase [Hirschia sp.]MBF19768.1 uroporphyrinogen-III C-methyltransferase [Hirschia sp.]